MSDDESFDFSSDEYNYIDDNDREYQSDDDELEKFIIDEIYNTDLVQKYENILYGEFDAKNDDLCSDMFKIDCLLNKTARDNDRLNILKKIYSIIKNSINKFNNIKKISNNNYIIIPIVDTYIFYTGIDCYITNNINEIENTVNKIINLFETIDLSIDDYNLKEIDETNIKESIMNKNKNLEMNKIDIKEEDIKVFMLNVNFINKK